MLDDPPAPFPASLASRVVSQTDGFVDDDALAASGRAAQQAPDALIEITSDPVDERRCAIVEVRKPVGVLGELADGLHGAGMAAAVADAREGHAVRRAERGLALAAAAVAVGAELRTRARASRAGSRAARWARETPLLVSCGLGWNTVVIGGTPRGRSYPGVAALTGDGAVATCRSSATARRRIDPINSANAAGVRDCAPSLRAFSGIGVHLDHETVGARRDRGPRHRRHQVAVARGVGGIDDHRQVRQRLDHGHRAEVERVARRRLERADAALAEDHVRVAVSHHVLGGEQPLLDGVAQPALQEHRAACAADSLEQREVLGVAGADLEHVGVLRHQVHVCRGQHLGDHRQPGGLTRFGEVAQPVEAEPAKRVRRRARLEGASAEHARARVRHIPRGREHLLAALDGARSGDDDEGSVAEADAGDIDHGWLRMPLPRDLLVRLAHRDRVDHAGKIADRVAYRARVAAEHADREAIRAGQLDRLETALADVPR